MLTAMAHAKSLVFEPAAGPVDVSSLCWWEFRLGASCRAPLEPGWKTIRLRM